MNKTLHEYLSSLLRHGWGESWLPALTDEQVAMIAALAGAEVVKRLTENSHEGQ